MGLPNKKKTTMHCLVLYNALCPTMLPQRELAYLLITPPLKKLVCSPIAPQKSAAGTAGTKWFAFIASEQEHVKSICRHLVTYLPLTDNSYLLIIIYISKSRANAWLLIWRKYWQFGQHRRQWAWKITAIFDIDIVSPIT
jgi:hypothetical protein